MARTKKASDLKNRKSVKQNQPSEPSSQDKTVPIETSAVSNNVNGVLDNKQNDHPQTSVKIVRNTDQISVGETLTSMEGNVNFPCTLSDGKIDVKQAIGSATNEAIGSATNEANVNDASAITDDLEMSGVSALMTDDSRASSVIDLTESINETKENEEEVNDDSQQQEVSTADRRKSIRKPLKRLVCATTPFYGMVKERTSKGTPYIRKVSSLAKKMRFSSGKKERIAEEVKKSANVKRVTFNNSPSMNKAAKLNQSKPQLESTNKKQSAVKMPNFGDIHKKLFEKMESIDVTVRKREERMNAASTIKVNKGSAQEKDKDTATKPKKVVRKLDNNFLQVPSNRSQSINSESANSELPKSVRPKSLRAAPTVEVLQERSNRDPVFKFTGSSDPKVAAQPTSSKKIAENRSTRRQQAYKARPMPNTQPKNSDRLKGVRLNRRFQLQMKYREDQNEL